MQCEEFESRLNDLLDERLPIDRDAALRAHAAACGDCRRAAAGYGALFQGLAGLPAPECDAALAWRVVAQCHALRKRRRAVRYAFAGLAAAAAAIVVVGYALRDPRGPQLVDSQPSSQGAAHVEIAQEDVSPPEAIPPNAPLERPSPDRTAQASTDAADPNAVLARETRQTLAGAFLLLPGLKPTKPEGAISPEEDAAADVEVAAAGSYGEVGDELKPLTDSTAGALGFLMNVLPGRGKLPPPAPPGS